MEDYIGTIRLKTSVLLRPQWPWVREYGSLGRARERMVSLRRQRGVGLPIQDDYLDTFGESGSTGKQVGGDILSDKKTLLWLTTKRMLNAARCWKLGRGAPGLWYGPGRGQNFCCTRCHGEIRRTKKRVVAEAYVEEAHAALGELIFF